MKVGDCVKTRWNDCVGVIIEKRYRAVPDGNPNGDFTRELQWRVQWSDGRSTWVNARCSGFGRPSLELVSESR